MPSSTPSDDTLKARARDQNTNDHQQVSPTANHLGMGWALTLHAPTTKLLRSSDNGPRALPCHGRPGPPHNFKARTASYRKLDSRWQQYYAPRLDRTRFSTSASAVTTRGFLDEGVGIAKVAILTSPGPRVTVDCIHAITKVPSCFSLSTPSHCPNPRSCMAWLARMRVQVEAAWRHRCGSTPDNLACRARPFLTSFLPPNSGSDGEMAPARTL